MGWTKEDDLVIDQIRKALLSNVGSKMQNISPLGQPYWPLTPSPAPPGYKLNEAPVNTKVAGPGYLPPPVYGIETPPVSTLETAPLAAAQGGWMPKYGNPYQFGPETDLGNTLPNILKIIMQGLGGQK